MRDHAAMIARLVGDGDDLIVLNKHEASAIADALASLTRELEEAEKLNAAMREARHVLGRDVNHVAGFLEVTAKRHERGALAATEYSQRLTDCADILRNALAGRGISSVQTDQSSRDQNGTTS